MSVCVTWLALTRESGLQLYFRNGSDNVIKRIQIDLDLHCELHKDTKAKHKHKEFNVTALTEGVGVSQSLSATAPSKAEKVFQLREAQSRKKSVVSYLHIYFYVVNIFGGKHMFLTLTSSKTTEGLTTQCSASDVREVESVKLKLGKAALNGSLVSNSKGCASN